MQYQWLVNLVIYLFMIAIVFSLGSALYYLVYNREHSERTVKALTIRIGLSLILFILLFAAFGMGLIKPHGLNPIANTQTQTKTTTPHPQSANTKQQPQTQNGAEE
jgi:flagellar basal body-associated protein FliL